MKRRALVVGATGQLGSYLCELLLTKDYQVFALVRRSSCGNLSRLAGILDAITIVPGDLTDQQSLNRAMLTNPDEVYNLGAQSHVGTSFHEAEHTANVTGLGALRLFEAVRLHTTATQHPHVYQASTSEMFGNHPPPQCESTPFDPQSPYGAAKVFAHHYARMYRRAYQLPISCGINFNFESERRSPEFVTRKITQGIAAIKTGQATELRLGNLAARRDWSHAQDVAQAAWLMLQQEEPDDYVIASGETRTVQEFLEYAFNYAALDYHKYLKVDPAQFRPLDVHHLRGCAEKAKSRLGWAPTVDFPMLVRRMVDHDLALAEERLARHG